MARLPLQPAMVSNQALFEWSVKLHNEVNRRLGKPDVSIQKAKTLYK